MEPFEHNPSDLLLPSTGAAVSAIDSIMGSRCCESSQACLTSAGLACGAPVSSRLFGRNLEYYCTRHPRVTTFMTGPGHVLMRSPSSAPYKGAALASRPFHELHDYLSTMAGSLDQNPPNADRHITAGGSDWLWAVFAIMALSDLIMIFWTFSRPRGTRLFHQIAVIVLTTATIAYFSMASDLGATPVRAEFSRGNTINRQIWYVRYIQWFITLPLLLLELLLATGLSLSDIFTTMFMAWVLVVCGLVGALVPSTYKWGYFVLGCCALLYIWYVGAHHRIIAHPY
ncbi:hypothetical protein NUW54_g12724 [Trametes sanguinea]|uniref:Uncharacterized protein n=1 Tax=Trametes sanguinea TaxID=158606 RepID=A0ACC1MV21_9APHY|nr:hypothetical protein NUW54_g12724 [Trametes sanguinea]